MFRAFASALADSEAPLSIAAPVPGLAGRRAGPGDLRVANRDVSADPDRAPSDWAAQHSRIALP